MCACARARAREVCLDYTDQRPEQATPKPTRHHGDPETQRGGEKRAQIRACYPHPPRRGRRWLRSDALAVRAEAAPATSSGEHAGGWLPQRNYATILRPGCYRSHANARLEQKSHNRRGVWERQPEGEHEACMERRPSLSTPSTRTERRKRRLCSSHVRVPRHILDRAPVPTRPGADTVQTAPCVRCKSERDSK